MIFKQFAFNSIEYKQSLALREQVLRAPLGLSLSEQDLLNEEQQLHFGLFEQNQILAVVVFNPLGKNKLKLRQMAVSNNHQGQGLGKMLVQSAELEVAKVGYKEIEMAAREAAIGFYQTLGYQTIGDNFEQVGVLHQTMTKDL